MALFGSLFGRKDAPPAAPRTFDFAFGQAGLQDALDVINAASRANDEATLRAVFDFLDGNASREEEDKVEASKSTYAALVLGRWLNNQKRFAEAEVVLKRARGWKKVMTGPFLDSRFALADAIWSQGHRERAEKEALVWIDKRLRPVAAPQWPISKYRAKLAQYCFNFADQARWEAQSFEEGEADQPGDLEKRRADPVLQMKTALAYYNAGRDTPARAHLDRALECAQTTDNRQYVLMALNLQAFWQSRTDDWQGVPALGNLATQWAGDDPVHQSTARRIRASIAHAWGDFDAEERLLNTPDPTGTPHEQTAALINRQVLSQTRGRFEEARQFATQRAALFPVASRDGSRSTAICHIGRVELELRAHYCGEVARLDQSLAALSQAATLLRGDEKLGVWVRALMVAVRAAQGDASAASEALAVEAEYPKWSDAGDTRMNLCEALCLSWFYLGNAPRAAYYAEGLAHMAKTPLLNANARELWARALHASGDTARARELWEQVAACPFDAVAVRLARRALNGDAKSAVI